MVNQQQKPFEKTEPASNTNQQTTPVCELSAKVIEEINKAISTGMNEAINNAASNADTAGKQAREIFEKGTEEAGRVMHFIGENPFVKNTLKLFRAEWLLGLVGQVDVAKAEAAVKKLQQENPTETPNQIAARIINEKALQAGGIGLVSSLIPGIALALLAIDLAATTQLQAEMIFQIAAAYGMDLQAPARKGEVLAIFGLGLGGSEALKAGLGILRNVPVAGVAIGAGTNAVIFYTLGYAAQRFYETKLHATVANQ